MAGKNIYNDKDSMDINELAALNEDISDEMLEQLTSKLSADMNANPNNVFSDGALFEEPKASKETTDEKASEQAENPVESPVVQENKTPETTPSKKTEVKLDESFDDNFIKKYKAKLNKQSMMAGAAETGTGTGSESKTETVKETIQDNGEPIEKISQGNITEKTISKEQIEYNDSLDFLDGNVKYSKYVIYVDPQNVDFIESLTVKERKNLINGILRQQGDITLTKQRFRVIQTIIRHAIVAILTITISIPIIYYAINASLEATINNHRQSQTVWQALYRENGKISTQKN